MLRALRTQARPFWSNRTTAATHQFVFINIGARHFTTRSPNKMSDIAPQISPESATTTTVTAAPTTTSSADKKKKQQHPHANANANANAKQKPKAPPKKEVRILMLHGLFTPPSALISGQLWLRSHHILTSHHNPPYSYTYTHSLLFYPSYQKHEPSSTYLPT